MNTCTIYVLRDPRTNAIRYVGRTVQPLQFRLANHVREARKGECHPRATWIRDVLAAGVAPIIEALAHVPNDKARQSECEWTKVLLERGENLTNSNLWGCGCDSPKTYARWTDETRALLGRVADAVIAEMVGVTRKAVSYERRKRGIPASHDRTRNTPPPPMAGHNRKELPEHIVARLGTMPDYQLAQMAGVSKKRIINERHKRGVLSYAAQTGNTGQYQEGHYPTRWLKQR